MKRAGIEVGVAAGLAVVYPLYLIFTVPEMCDSPRLTHGESFALMASFASYLSAPSLFGRLRARRGAGLVWLWTAAAGSLLSACALYCLVGRSFGWGLGLFAKAWLALCVWTLPFAAAVYYSVVIVRRIRRWKAS